ncbi:receptor-like protein 48 [Nymphaea colorata]|uniref:Leucine-rich repeat-containing N-terminal plant-type domain-containing protein n=1 Tax=Nymphaea colorata TaxID=210225 RepID=A0A5K1BNC5_9MAGN|nr:receptor-like protein 48 [Nymphaea colorata]
MLRRLATVFLFTTLLILLTQPPPAASTVVLCHLNESSALLRFKHSISKFLFPGALSSWQGNGSDCCRWQGITCHSVTGFVIKLQIPYVTDGHIVGSIDPSLFELKQLQLLDLSGNGFNGSIPKRLLELTNLTHLDLSDCRFTGQIPEELLGMTWLISLNLSMNDYSVGLQLQRPNLTTLLKRLDQLQHLQIGDVEVSMSGRDVSTALLSSPSLQKLKTLSLSNCIIVGPLLEEPFLHMQSLSHLDLSFNNLLGTFPPNIFLLPKLETLYISFNIELAVLLPPRNLTRSVNIRHLLLSSIGELSDGPLVPSNPPSQPRLEVTSNTMNGSTLSSCTSTRISVRNLSSGNPPGLIPEGLCSFSHLINLTLAHNSLNGTIPTCFSCLSSLEWLDLSYNHLSGSIPSSLFTLPSLILLDLSYNMFSGSLPKFYNPSSNLTILLLDNNLLSGDISFFMHGLPSLAVATLSSNNITSIICPFYLSRQKTLKYLDLSNNRNLRVEMSDSNNNTSMMNPSHNNTSMMNPSQLEYLNLRSCDIQSFPTFICELGKLQFLDLSSNNIEGKISACLWGITGFRLLNLDHNKFDGFQEPTNTTRAIGARLSLLSVSSNRINGMIPTFLCNYIAESVKLDMSNNALTGAIPDCLCKVSHLNLSNNQLQGQIPNGFNNIQLIDLNSNILTGTIPKSIASNITSLKSLNLGNNKLEDAFPGWLSQLTKLKVLVLRSNRLYGPIFTIANSLQAFPALKIFDISSNHFSGTLPHELFEGLKAMMQNGSEDIYVDNDVFSAVYVFHLFNVSTYFLLQGEIEQTIKGNDRPITSIKGPMNIVDMSNNNFTGEIPEEIGRLKYLHGLNVSNNHLKGLIPNSFDNLLQLEWLDTSHNQLSGPIPEGLADLTFLSILNLSYNDLQGRIPQGKQFSTFDESSFKGNPKLCGAQIEKTCYTGGDGDKEAMNKRDEEMQGWKYGSLGIGFAVGLMIITLPLVFVESVANWFWDETDKMIEFLLMQIGPSKFGKRRNT